MGTKILFAFLILSSLLSLSDAARNRTRTNRNRSQREGRQRAEVILSCTMYNAQCAMYNVHNAHPIHLLFQVVSCRVFQRKVSYILKAVPVPGFYLEQIGEKRAEIAPTQFLLQSCVIRQNPKIFWAIFVQNVLMSR